jgi:hypothetical protein
MRPETVAPRASLGVPKAGVGTRHHKRWTGTRIALSSIPRRLRTAARRGQGGQLYHICVCAAWSVSYSSSSTSLADGERGCLDRYPIHISTSEIDRAELSGELLDHAKN